MCSANEPCWWVLRASCSMENHEIRVDNTHPLVGCCTAVSVLRRELIGSHRFTMCSIGVVYESHAPQQTVFIACAERMHVRNKNDLIVHIAPALRLWSFAMVLWWWRCSPIAHRQVKNFARCCGRRRCACNNRVSQSRYRSYVRPTGCHCRRADTVSTQACSHQIEFKHMWSWTCTTAYAVLCTLYTVQWPECHQYNDRGDRGSA